jgi:Domain of Unknown Function (DUF1206)
MRAAGIGNPVEWMGRLGYGARGIVYLIVGALAVLAATGSGGKTTDTKGALQVLFERSFGDALLGLVAFGLLGFALWRVFQAVADADHHGRDLKGLGIRVALGVSAAIYLSLAVFAVSLAVGWGTGGGGEGAARDWTAWLLARPFGRWLVGAVGAAIAGAGIGIGWKGWHATFERRLALSPHARRWVVPAGRFGLLTRGVVFLLIGGFFVTAAVQSDPAEAKGISGALRTLQAQPYGGLLLGIVAFGLFAFGLFGIVQAIYRRIDAPDASQAVAPLIKAAG